MEYTYLECRQKVLCGVVVRLEVDAANAQVVPCSDVPWTQLERAGVCVDGLGRAVAVGERGAEFVPQRRVGGAGSQRRLEAINSLVILVADVEEHSCGKMEHVHDTMGIDMGHM